MVWTKRIAIALISGGSVAVIALAQTTAPSTTATTQSAYDRLLGTEPTLAEKPLQPTQRRSNDASTGAGAIAPGAPQLPTKREGTFIIDRTGRLARAADGQGWEFNFEADGQTLQDPPMKVLPNLKLMVMEEAIDRGGSDVRFRVSGSLTEYRGRNYILLEKVIVAQDR
jgi:hypothetical protein